MKHSIKSAFAVLLSVSLFTACTKENNAPDPHFFDGTTLGFDIRRNEITNPKDSLNTGHITCLVNGTSGNGKDIKALVVFEDSNHVAFSLTIKAVDYLANDYYFTVAVPSGVNQLDTAFIAGDRIQVIGISSVNQ